MANLCIIPARGGSKRIPKKYKIVFRKPILLIPLKCNSFWAFDEVMVSTDIEIAEIAIQYGAKFHS
jgi:CMP-N-acetylneuraminic acid synthetase